MNLKNKLQEKFHQVYKSREIKNHYLQYLFLEITKKCNLDCLHCGSDCSKDLQSPELTTDSWFNIIDYFKQTYSESVAFVITGGEPLVHPDLVQIGHYIKSQKMRWGMVTNGMLLNSRMLQNLLDAGIYSITISLDGLEENHNWLRNNSKAYQRAIEAIRMVAGSGIPYQDVVSCVSPRNLHELDEIANILIETGMKEWRLFRIFPSGRAKDEPLLQLSFEQTQQMLNWIQTNKKSLAQKGLNVNLSCEGWIPFDQDKKVRDFPFFCRSGINIASILSDGTITGCSNNSKGFHVGNILNDNFAGLWNDKFEQFRERKWIKDTYCSECKHLRNCQGGSIHLWESGQCKPNFCYAVDVLKFKT